ncbi:hypothetical protein OFY01_06425 [Streptomyces sp. GXMU-J5]|uniref:Uncharacterized protein n=1 Tax=Streptomyces beihaiensis TaxID=2984495 RepID=A0ABT3TQU4_9ACTN|nr:hypothetical protein [Streptomyces beihaiensis]MCX3059405.1 hypothetical protein [Streptomyces beihaiensis]
MRARGLHGTRGLTRDRLAAARAAATARGACGAFLVSLKAPMVTVTVAVAITRRTSTAAAAR